MGHRTGKGQFSFQFQYFHIIIYIYNYKCIIIIDCNYNNTHNIIYNIYIHIYASQVTVVVKNPPANVGDLRDMSSVPGLGRSPGEGYGNPVQYSCLENPIDRRVWRATFHRVTQSLTLLK